MVRSLGIAFILLGLSACSVFDYEPECLAAQKDGKTMMCCPVGGGQWRCAWIHKITEG